MGKKRKGQYLSLLTVFALAFIGSGHIFVEVAQGTMITGEADRAIGDPERAAEAKTYSEIYKTRLPAMLNYSVNTGAYQTQEEEPDIDSSSDFEKDDLIEIWKSQSEDDLEARNTINSYRCSNISPPEVEISEIEDQEFSLSLMDDHIVCEDSDIDIYVDHQISDDISVESPNNRFETILEDLSNLAEEIESNSELETIEDSDESECLEDASEEASELEEELEENVESEIGESGENAVDSYNLEDGLEHNLQIDYDAEISSDSDITTEECEEDEERAEAWAEAEIDEIIYDLEVYDDEKNVLTREGSVSLSFGFNFFDR